MTEEWKDLQPGDNHYKAYVGPVDRYDYMGATQFRLLTSLGLRAHHKVLDFGCGSLRSGKLFIPYLEAGNYFGQEPQQWLIDEGIRNELGPTLIELKRPRFSNRDDFVVGFDEHFDYIVAQSIFSHTNFGLMQKGIHSIVESLCPTGVALVTIVEGKDYTGGESWVYPGCTTYRPRTIAKVLNETGGYWRRLWWFHPAQTWFAISKSKSNLPSALDAFFLLGGEEVGSRQYKFQHFFSNRLQSLIRRHYVLKELAMKIFRMVS